MNSGDDIHISLGFHRIKELDLLKKLFNNIILKLKSKQVYYLIKILTDFLPMIKTYRSSKTIIKTSTKAGNGLIASENILADEIIAIRVGHIVNKEEALKRDREIGDFSLQISDEFYI